MRILLSAYACKPNAGTEPGYGWNWATHLAARGLDVHVLANHRNQSLIEETLRSNPIGNLRFTFVRVPFRLAAKSEALHYAWWQQSALSVAQKLHKEQKFDLAHHVTYGSIHVPSPLSRLRIPLVFGPVGGGQTAPDSMLSYFGPQERVERWRTILTRTLKWSPIHQRRLGRMSFILAANRDTLNIIEALGCKNVQLMCDAGLPNDYFSSSPRCFDKSSSTLKLLWVGRMLARKALPLALDALKNTRANVTLTIAGDGMEPQAVRAMINERNLQNRVFWKGARLTWAELRTAYMEHDAMLFTSLRDSFGSQMLEAMAVGLPIITLDLHGARDFVPHAASLKVAVGTPETTVRNLSEAIENYYSLPGEIKNRMSESAWNFAQTLSWPERAAFAENLYRYILSGNTRSEATSAVLMTGMKNIKSFPYSA